MEEQDKNINLNQKRKWMKIISPLLIVGVVGGVILVGNNGSKLPSNGTGLSGYVIAEGVQPGLTKEEIQEMLDRQVNETEMLFSINSMPVFNGTVGTIMFANPPYNAHDIDLTVYLDGKEIIKTGKIKPNQYIDQIELIGGSLKKGEYVGTGVITAYHKDTGEIVGQTNVEMDIISQ